IVVVDRSDGPDAVPGRFDGATGYVVLQIEGILQEALRMELLAQGNPTFIRYCMVGGRLGPAQVRQAEALWQLFQPHARLFQVLFDRTCAEEVRHAMDRSRAAAPARALGSYYNQL